MIRRWLSRLQHLAIAILLMPSFALATGTLTIPQTIAALAAGNQPASLLDQNWTAIQSYINAREITIDVVANRPAAGTKGRYYFATDTNGGTLYNDTGTSWQQLAASVTGSLAQQITGLTLSNDSGFPSTFVDVVTGAASSDDAVTTNRVLMVLSSTFAKKLTAWTVGTVQGCLDAGVLAASTWYHVFLIQRVDTGVVDILCSTSATAPTMPTNYTKKRRIGSILTDAGSAINFFTQVTTPNGSAFFKWATVPALNINSAPPNAGANTATAVTPNGVVVQALQNFWLNTGTSANAVLYISALTETDQAAAGNAAPLGLLVGPGAAGANSVAAGQAVVWTDTSRQFRFRLSATGAADIVRAATVGWYDPL